MRTSPQRIIRRRSPAVRMITPGSEEFGFSAVFSNVPALVSGAWIAANDPVAVPFTLRDAVTVTQLGWVNGTAVGGGVDMGIYTEGWVRLVSIGGVTAAGTASGWEFNDIANTVIPSGRYYLAYARDNTTANRTAWYPQFNAVNPMKLLGLFDSTTDAYPLPDPLTNMVLAAQFTRVPPVAIKTIP